jgi:hypothetical protein
MSYAVGVLISVSFMHIMPKSFQMNETGPAFLLVGFLGTHLANRLYSTKGSYTWVPELPFGTQSLCADVTAL